MWLPLTLHFQLLNLVTQSLSLMTIASSPLRMWWNDVISLWQASSSAVITVSKVYFRWVLQLQSSEHFHQSSTCDTYNTLFCSNNNGCQSKLRVLRAASTHYPVLRQFLHQLTSARTSHRCIDDIDQALCAGQYTLFITSANRLLALVNLPYYYPYP